MQHIELFPAAAAEQQSGWNKVFRRSIYDMSRTVLFPSEKQMSIALASSNSDISILSGVRSAGYIPRCQNWTQYLCTFINNIVLIHFYILQCGKPAANSPKNMICQLCQGYIAELAVNKEISELLELCSFVSLISTWEKVLDMKNGSVVRHINCMRKLANTNEIPELEQPKVSNIGCKGTHENANEIAFNAGIHATLLIQWPLPNAKSCKIMLYAIDRPQAMNSSQHISQTYVRYTKSL